jgi:uncharacterized protein YndB with AHSA1/START domain
MLKFITALAVVLALALAVVLALALTKPDDFTVARATTIKAPPDKIFPLIDDLHAWNAWSPYEKKDPAMQRTFSGAPRGKGAVYQWSGNGNVGSGRMEIVESTPQKIVIKLDFITPFEGHNVASFTLAPNADATEVTWSMHGPAPLLSKVMQVFFNMDRMIGDDFAAGLASLKAVAEK